MATSPTPNSVLAQAIHALELAKARGDENQATYADAQKALSGALEEIVQHDGNLDWREIPPSGDD